MVGDLMNIKKLRTNYTKHTFNPLYSHMKRAIPSTRDTDT
jgi:hypothetical protein